MRDDATITIDVKKALAEDYRVSALDINVSTRQGVVTIRGVVDTEGQRTAAEDAANAIQGVRGVQNELSVRFIESGAGSDEMADYEEEETWVAS